MGGSTGPLILPRRHSWLLGHPPLESQSGPSWNRVDVPTRSQSGFRLASPGRQLSCLVIDQFGKAGSDSIDRSA